MVLKSNIFTTSAVKFETTHLSMQKLSTTHPNKIDLNRKWLPKQKTIQNSNIDAQGFSKTRNENPPTREIGVTS